MTDQTNLPVPVNGPVAPPQRRSARGLLLTLFIVLAAGLTGAVVTQAMSEESGWGPGFGLGGGQHGGWMGGPVARELLTRPTIDRAELERFRAEHMAMWDKASKRIVQAFTAAAEALTPAQRQKIGEFLSERKGFWHGWHRG